MVTLALCSMKETQPCQISFSTEEAVVPFIESFSDAAHYFVCIGFILFWEAQVVVRQWVIRQ